VARTTKKSALGDAAWADSDATEPSGAESEDLEVSSGPWRDRVVARSLGAARTQSIDRGAAFVKAATEILRVEGESLTVQDVADAAGYSLRIMYRHFESKDDLLAAVLEESQSALAKRIKSQLRKIDDPVERLAAMVAALIVGERTPFSVALAKHELLLVTVRPDQVARAHVPMAKLVVDVVNAVAEAGKLPSGQNPKQVASLIFDTTRSHNHAKLLGDATGLGVTPPLASEVVRYCLNGIGLSLPEHPPTS
jgi:AcrR family transcriptional regulator